MYCVFWSHWIASPVDLSIICVGWHSTVSKSKLTFYCSKLYKSCIEFSWHPAGLSDPAARNYGVSFLLWPGFEPHVKKILFLTTQRYCERINPLFLWIFLFLQISLQNSLLVSLCQRSLFCFFCLSTTLAWLHWLPVKQIQHSDNVLHLKNILDLAPSWTMAVVQQYSTLKCIFLLFRIGQNWKRLVHQ